MWIKDSVKYINTYRVDLTTPAGQQFMFDQAEVYFARESRLTLKPRRDAAPSHPRPDWRDPGDVLLTGATGFLGAQLAGDQAVSGVEARPGLLGERDRRVRHIGQRAGDPHHVPGAADIGEGDQKRRFRLHAPQ